ncbi:uncharacterized protein LOC128730214 [Anopheles nili]|uniref:uncharacterized protein LOC128730214 n=1 Tax=Anopheles nili TaxID=185578 RepID=UPI00237A56F8|nr:uncharacterized protein LOC128730214 [Anopheles nili]
MASTNLDNLVHIDRSLSWRAEPICDWCSLPFTNKSDDLAHRLPFLLSCQHLLCSQCVREHAHEDQITCKRCKQHTPLSARQHDPTKSLYPSFYLLGVMERLNEELHNLKLYWEEEKNAESACMDTKCDVQDFRHSTWTPYDMDTPKKAKLLIENAYHAYEKSKYLLENRARKQTENINRMVIQVNAHFLTLHNAMQIEEDRVLRLIRNSFLEQRQQNKYQQQQLQSSKLRLEELFAQVKQFPEKTSSPDEKWTKFCIKVQKFLERDPVKLPSDNRHLNTTISFAKNNDYLFSTVMVTCVVSPREFYVQDVQFDEDLKILNELCKIEAETYNDKLISNNYQLSIEVHSLYLARPKSSTNWYRAKVLKSTDASSNHLGTYVVQYIDFGRTEGVEYSQIRPISVELSKFDPKAVKCSLYNVIEPRLKETSNKHRGEWPKECAQIMIDFINSQKMIMFKVYGSKTTSTAKVDLFLPPQVTMQNNKSNKFPNLEKNCWDGYYAPMSLRSTLLYLGQCDMVQGFKNDTMADRVSWLTSWVQKATDGSLKLGRIPTAPELKAYDMFDVTITNSISPDNFYVMPSSWRKIYFDSLQQQLETLCLKQECGRIFCPYQGLVCSFTVTNNDVCEWFRGRVEKVLNAGCEMFALDTGSRMFVQWTDMRLLPPLCAPLNQHVLAVKCRLELILPKSTTDNPSWTGEAIKEFNQYTCSSTLSFSVRIGQYYKQDEVYNVVLYTMNKFGSDLCMNGLLVDHGHAECTGNREEIKDRIWQSNEEATDNIAEPIPKIIDSRVPVDVLTLVSPYEIYVRLCSRATALEQLHQIIQEHMDDPCDDEDTSIGDKNWLVGDMCVVYAAPAGSDGSEWYRAQVINVLERGKEYEAFLIDRAGIVKVHHTNMARITARICQVQPGAIRCRLACIDPIGGNAVWHQSSLDGFKQAVKSFDSHAISLDAKETQTSQASTHQIASILAQSLSVVLWGVRASINNALEPQRTQYRNINQLLMARGLAHCTGRFRTFAKKGSGAVEEMESLESAIHDHMCAEYEKIQQFFRRVAAVSREETRAPRDGSKTAQTVLNGAESLLMDPTYAASMGLANTLVENISAWPESIQIDKKEFVAIPTYVGNDGTIYLYDLMQEPILNRIRDVINEYVQKNAPNDEDDKTRNSTFAPGQICLVKFHQDGLFYRGVIIDIIANERYHVQFVDYGNVENCSSEDIRREIVCGQVPVQINRFKLACIMPKGQHSLSSKWSQSALDACHRLIVQKQCLIRVEEYVNASCDATETPHHLISSCRIHLVDGKIDVAKQLVDMGLFERTFKTNARKSIEEMISLPSTPMIADPGTNRSLFESSSKEHRNILSFLGNIHAEYRSFIVASEYEDPNELPEVEDDSDWMNRAQVINPEMVDDNDPGTIDQQMVQIYQTESPMPSPASFCSSEFETSSRLSDTNSDSECSPTSNDPLFRCFTQQPSIDRKIADRGFFAEFTNYDDGLILYVYPHLEGHTQQMMQMAEKIQQVAIKQNRLHLWQASMLEPGSPCLAPYREDGRYYRAILETVDQEQRQARVLYVDYLNRDTLPMSELRKCPVRLQHDPLRNIQVRLAGIRPNPRLRVDDIAQRLVLLLQRPFFVKVVFSPAQPHQDAVRGVRVLDVKLYSDQDCAKLTYQKMIDEKYFYIDSK